MKNTLHQIFSAFTRLLCRNLLCLLGSIALLSAGPLSATEISVGGGLLDSGLIGRYYDNASFAGEPVFERRDIRLDFDWGTHMKPGGGIRGYHISSLAADNYSIRWEGRVMARFSESYTIKAYADAVRLWIKPAAQVDWGTAQLDTFGAVEPSSYAAQTFDFAFTAGEAYDIKVEYREQSGPAMMRLFWESASTPEEVIQPTAIIAQKPPSSRYLLADGGMTGTYWGEDYAWGTEPASKDGNFVRDAEGWPAEDFRFIITPNDPENNPGTYLLSFNGTARVMVHLYNGETFSSLDGTVDFGGTLDIGEGYDPATNTTEVLMHLPDNGNKQGMPQFHYTDRDGDETVGGGTAYGLHSGVTNLRLMRPLAKNSPTPHAKDILFHADAIDAMDRFVAYRWNDVNDNGNVEWSDRQNLRGVSTTDTKNINDEYKILWCNRTGRDLWLQVPHRASDDYVTKLAQLLRYGSDENYQPYTHPQSDPYFPPLNPNLKVYLEYSNEAPWNTGGQYPQGGWIQNRAEDFRQAWFVDPNSAEGQQWQILNYDGKFQTSDSTKSIGGMDAGKRFYALRLKQISDIFRTVWGDEAMPAPGKSDPRIRPNLTYQYDNTNNTARDALFFMDHYFNKTDPASTYTGTPRPVNSYYYGGGPATYYASDDRLGIVTGHPLNDTAVGGFESANVAAGVGDLAPAGTDWRFEGVAGIHRQPDRGSMTLGSLGASSTAVDSYTLRGFQFTVGADDIAVQQVGRYRLSGNKSKHSISIYDAATNARIGSTEVDLTDVAEGEIGYVLTGQKNFIASNKFFTHPWILEAGKTYYLVSQETNNGDSHFTSAELSPPAGITIDGTAKGWNDDGTWTWQVGSTANRAFGPVDMQFTPLKTVTSDGQTTLGFLNMSKEDRTEVMRSNRPENTSEQALFIAGTGAAEIDVIFSEPGTYAFIYHLAYKRDQQPWFDADGNGNPSDDRRVLNEPNLKLIDGATEINISPSDQTDVRPGNGNWGHEGYWIKPSAGYDFTSSAPFEITAEDVGKTYTLRIETDNENTDDVLLMDNFVVSNTAYMMAGTIPGSGGLAEGDPGVSGWENRVRNMYVYVQTFGLRATAYEGGWYPGGDGNKMPIQFAASFFDPAVLQGEQNAINALARAGVMVNADYTFDFAMPDYDLANADEYVRIQAWDLSNAHLRPETDNGLPINSTYSLSNVWWSNDGFTGNNEERLLRVGESLEPGDWAAWNVIAPATGTYTFKVDTTPGGAFALLVDDSEVLSGNSGTVIETAAIFLTKGLHSVRLVGSSGSFGLNAVFGAAEGEPYGVSGLTGVPGNQKAVLSWNFYPVVVDGYNVYTRPIVEENPNVAWTLQTVSPVPEPAYTVSGLNNNTYYEFVVRAVINGAETAWSNSILLQPRVEAPVAPQIQRIDLDQSAGTVLIDWKLPDGALPVADADTVVIRYGTDPGNLNQSVTVPTGTDTVLSGIDTLVPLYFAIEGTNAAGTATTPVLSAYRKTMNFSGVAVGERPVGWTDTRDPQTSGTVTALVVAEPNPPTVDWPADIVSPSGTPMLLAYGHSRNAMLTEDAAANLRYYGVETMMSWGGSNNYDYFGLNMLNSGPDSHIYVHIEADSDLWVHSRDGSAHTWKRNIDLVPDEGEAIGDRAMDAGEWWKLDMRAYPAADGSDALDIHVRIVDETGASRIPAALNGSNYGRIEGDVWVLPNVPKPLNGAQGTYGVYSSNAANGTSPNKGHWFDSVRVFPLSSIESENAAPEVTSATGNVSMFANDTFSYTMTVSDSDSVSLTALQIPPFLSFTDNGDGTGTLTGTPADSDIAEWVIVLRADDGVNDPVDTVFTLDVKAAITAPVITTDPVSQTVTEGDSVSFTVQADNGGGTLSYQWKRGSTNVGSDSATLSLSNVSSADAGSYTVTVTNEADSVTSAAATLTVNVETGSGAFLEVDGLVSMEAENATARIEGTGSAAGITWQNQSDGAASGGVYVKALPGTGGVNTGEGSQGPRLDFDVSFATAGTYTIYIRMKGPNGTDDSVRLGVDGTILTTGGVGVTTGNSWSWRSAAAVSSTFTVSTAGNRTINVWMREDGTEVDKVVVTMGSAPTETGPSESATGAGADPAITSPTITTDPIPQTVTEGDTVTFTVAATDGGGTLSYQWKRGSINVGSNAATLSLSNVSSADAGSYTVVVSNQVDSVTSAAATLTVHPGGGTGGTGDLSDAYIQHPLLDLTFEEDVPGYYQVRAGNGYMRPLLEPGAWDRSPGNTNRGSGLFTENVATRHWYHKGDGVTNNTPTFFGDDGNYDGDANDVVGATMLRVFRPDETDGAGLPSNAFRLSLDQDYATSGLYLSVLNTTDVTLTEWYVGMTVYYAEPDTGNHSQLLLASAVSSGADVRQMNFTEFGDAPVIATGQTVNSTPAGYIDAVFTTEPVAPGEYLVIAIEDIQLSQGSTIFLDDIYVDGLEPLPGEIWTSQDIGNPGAAGSTSYDDLNDSFTIQGSGSDIWGGSDRFHFATLVGGLEGDGEITARVLSQTNTNGWAKAGVMIRDGLAANAAFAMMVVTPTSGVAFQRRNLAGTSAVHSGAAGAAPEWVKLSRVGDVFTASHSEDGVSWTQTGSAQTIPMGSTVEVGLCVTSHNNAVLSTVVMDHVQVSP